MKRYEAEFILNTMVNNVFAFMRTEFKKLPRDLVLFEDQGKLWYSETVQRRFLKRLINEHWTRKHLLQILREGKK